MGDAFYKPLKQWAYTPNEQSIADQFPHLVPLPILNLKTSIDYQKVEDAEIWCSCEFGSRGHRWFQFVGVPKFHFKTVADATLFKMRWY